MIEHCPERPSQVVDRVLRNRIRSTPFAFAYVKGREVQNGQSGRSTAGPIELDIPLNRDVFTRTLIRELAGTLEDVVGIEEASGYISVVGASIGEQINQSYKSALRVPRCRATRCAMCWSI